MSYRDDLDAAHARIAALEEKLKEAEQRNRVSAKRAAAPPRPKTTPRKKDKLGYWLLIGLFVLVSAGVLLDMSTHPVQALIWGLVFLAPGLLMLLGALWASDK